METAIAVEDVVIVGAGIAGLTTSLALHRLGIRSLVLESSDTLRVTGFALTIWTNAWKVLDAVGVGSTLRHQHVLLNGNVTTSLITGQQTSATPFNATGKHSEACEVRRVKRMLMLEALANELPSGTIRYMSKEVAIEESGFYKILHLADGTSIKTKVLIGCDGINSVVAKWLGFKKASYTGRYAVRGFVELETNHGLDPKFMQFFGNGFRMGVLPCDDKSVNWYFTWNPTTQDEEIKEIPGKLKELVLSKLEKMPSEVRTFIENTKLENGFTSVPLRYRHPLELILGNVSKGNVCVAGDAFHAMTPDIGQGGCCALEDALVLARCLAEALSAKTENLHIKENDEAEEHYKRIEKALKKYANDRRWRSIDLISTSYMVGYIQQSESKLISFLRDKFLAGLLAGLILKKSQFDCGNGQTKYL